MEDCDWVSLTLLWIVILIVTLALIQVKLTDVADPATTVNEKIVNAKLNQVREDLEGVTHKVYFDIQNNGSPAENFRDQIAIRRRITVSRSINFFFFSDSPASVALGWHMEPITHGDYLQTMKDNIGARLPLFTPEQKEEFSKCGKCKNGKIGIVQIPMWFEPYDKKSSSNAPEEIVKRAMDFTLGCDKSRWVQD